MTAWRMAFRAGKNGFEMWPYCRELGVAVIEYGPLDDIDLSQYSEGEPEDAWKQLASGPKASLKRVAYRMRKGDVIYVKQGPLIVGKGTVTGPYQFDSNNPIRDPNGAPWQHQRPVRWVSDFPEVRIQVGGNPYLTVAELTAEEVARIEKAAGRAGAPKSPNRVADESDIEGLRTEYRATKSKRSRRLRNMAFIKANGMCAVCGRNFNNFLGGRAIRVLQVHHRDQLSLRVSPAVTKLDDLVVVCANCHLLLHLDSKKALSVDELRGLLKNDDYLSG